MNAPAFDRTCSVAEYMERCNAYYYATRDPFGKQGDFITAPEISQIFGELIGAWVANQHSTLSTPYSTLIELGPGRGTLMKDALRATRNIPGFHAQLQVRLVETSPSLRTIQQENLKEYGFISWHETIESLPETPLFIIANEFFDALPIEQYVKVADGWRRRIIRWDKGYGLWDMDSRPAKPFGAPENVDEGTIYEVCPAAQDITRTLSTHIAQYGGAMLIIDYGYTGGSRKDTLQAVKHHHYHDPLQDPGEADITAHLDFDALARIGKRKGLAVHGAIPQGTFLQRLGGELRLEQLCKAATPAQQEQLISGYQRLIRDGGMGTLFKVMALTPLDTPSPAGF